MADITTPQGQPSPTIPPTLTPTNTATNQPPQPPPSTVPVNPQPTENPTPTSEDTGANFSEQELMYIMVAATYCEAATMAHKLLAELNKDLLVVLPSSAPEIKMAIENAKRETEEVNRLEAVTEIDTPDPLQPPPEEKPEEAGLPTVRPEDNPSEDIPF